MEQGGSKWPEFEIKSGGFTAILGPNGAGKSTTIQMLIGHSHLSEPKSFVLSKPS